MHRKTNTAMERLVALGAFMIDIASRTGVAAVQIATAAIAFGRRKRGSAIRTPALVLARCRAAAPGLVYASMLTLAIGAGGLTLAQRESPAPPDVAVADARDRLAAAERAGRSSRTDETLAGADSAMPVPAPAWVNPMPGAAISSCYGSRWGRMHQGIDFAGLDGSPILAAGAGTVFGVGWLYAGYGLSIVIDHGDGFFTHYAHASATNVVVGEKVAAGQTIASEGNTGNSTGPHLHFEVHQGLWSQVNPAQFLRDRGAAVGC